MYKKILETIKAYNKIIISRHQRPDGDALGAQFGLKDLILENFPNKQVKLLGDLNKNIDYGTMDVINDSFYEGALLIYVDVSSIEMLSIGVDYNKADKVITIDHHNSMGLPFADNYIDSSYAAACEMVADLALINNLKISKKTAEKLFCGIISDTNRFNYGLNQHLFEVVGNLVNLGIDYSSLYNKMYSESINFVRMKGYFMNKFVVTDNKVAYIKSDASIFDTFKVDFFTISRMMVNVMSNLKDVEIWANFTENPETKKVVCEFRSKDINIVDIAIKYGGGGHKFACGATVESFEIADQIINEFNLLVKERKN